MNAALSVNNRPATGNLGTAEVVDGRDGRALNMVHLGETIMENHDEKKSSLEALMRKNNHKIRTPPGQTPHAIRRMNKALAENWLGIVASLYVSVLIDAGSDGLDANWADLEACEKTLSGAKYTLVVVLILLNNVTVAISLVFFGAVKVLNTSKYGDENRVAIFDTYWTNASNTMRLGRVMFAMGIIFLPFVFALEPALWCSDDGPANILAGSILVGAGIVAIGIWRVMWLNVLNVIPYLKCCKLCCGSGVNAAAATKKKGMLDLSKEVHLEQITPTAYALPPSDRLTTLSPANNAQRVAVLQETLMNLAKQISVLAENMKPAARASGHPLAGVASTGHTLVATPSPEDEAAEAGAGRAGGAQVADAMEKEEKRGPEA